MAGFTQWDKVAWGWGNPETFPFTATPGRPASKTLQAGKKYRITCTQNAWTQIGANPTAAVHGTDSAYLAAGVPKEIVLDSADTTKTILSVVKDSSDGYCTIEESVFAE